MSPASSRADTRNVSPLPLGETSTSSLKNRTRMPGGVAAECDTSTCTPTVVSPGDSSSCTEATAVASMPAIIMAVEKTRTRPLPTSFARCRCSTAMSVSPRMPGRSAVSMFFPLKHFVLERTQAVSEKPNTSAQHALSAYGPGLPCGIRPAGGPGATIPARWLPVKTDGPRAPSGRMPSFAAALAKPPQDAYSSCPRRNSGRPYPAAGGANRRRATRTPP